MMPLTVLIVAGIQSGLVALGQPLEGPSLWLGAIDPEIHQAARLMAYQDATGGIWLEELDPSSGLAVNSTTRRLDFGAAQLRTTLNGPEFGITSAGWRLYYTKPHEGELQIWSVGVAGDAKPVWDDGSPRQSVLAGKNTNDASQRLIYIKGTKEQGAFHWADLDRPERESRICATMGADSPRWVEGTHTLVYASPEGATKGQVMLVDTEKRTQEVVSLDPRRKSFAYGWLAPEANGELLVLALIDQECIGIWRKDRSGAWQIVQEISPPDSTSLTVFGSPEPLVHGGRSMISAVLKSSGTEGRFANGEVWMFQVELDGDAGDAVLLSDAEVPRMRCDPETLAVDAKAFAYYNIFEQGSGYRIGVREFARAPISTGYDPASAPPSLSIRSEPGMRIVDAARRRAVDFRVTYPAQGQGPFPVILFSHGAWGNKDSHLPITELWAHHGYVVIQPDHLDSRNLGVEIGDQSAFRMWQERPRDMSFLIDSLEEIEASVPDLKGKIDASSIGVIGHSFGANTAQLVGGALAWIGDQTVSFKDPRVKSVAMLSGQGPGEMLTDASWKAFTGPLLVMTGSKDGPTRTGQPAEWRKLPYELSPAGNKCLVWVEGMDHGFGGVSGLKDGLYAFQKNADHVEYTKKITLAWWEATLKGDRAAEAYLKENTLGKATGGILAVSWK